MTTPIKIGIGLSLSGPLGANGRTAQMAQKIWEEDVNAAGGLLGRPIELVHVDDGTDPTKISGIYETLLDRDQVDLIAGGYGNNSLTPAMPLVISRKRYFVGLMGLGVNVDFNYPNYFAMIPTGPHPAIALTEGFFEIAANQVPRPETVAILAADADFSRNPVRGAADNAARLGFRIVSDVRYPLATQDFRPLMEALRSANPDVVLLCSYMNDSIGLVRAIAEAGLTPKIVGGAMIGPQSSSVKAALGPLLNGLVNYEYWLPVSTMMYPGVGNLIERYQIRAAMHPDVDALGYYVAPLAYAQMQVIGEAIAATRSLEDDKLAAYTRDTSFSTVAGKVQFGSGGDWTCPRVLQVQYQNIRGHEIAQFKNDGTRVVVSPDALASGKLIYPYAAAQLSQ